MLDFQSGGNLPLERVDLGAHDEPLAVANPRDCGKELVAERPILRLQIQQWNRGVAAGHQRTTISGLPQSA